MDQPSQPRFLLFEDHGCLVDGQAEAVARQLSIRFADRTHGSLLVFDADSGLQLDLDHSLQAEQLEAQLLTLWTQRCAPASPTPAAAPTVRRGPGRPKLGVVSREVTLLPRHWDWLNAQPGGASVSLRKLVEKARRATVGSDAKRRSQENAYRFINTLAGNLPAFEECCRALYAGDRTRFAELTQVWPGDVRSHAQRLAAAAFETIDPTA